MPRPPFRANGLDDRHRALLKFVAVGTPVNVDELAPPIARVAAPSSSSASSTAGAATGVRIEPSDADEHCGDGGFDDDVDRADADDEVVGDAEQDQLLLAAAAKLTFGGFSRRELRAYVERASPPSPSKTRRALGMQAGWSKKGRQAEQAKWRSRK